MWVSEIRYATIGCSDLEASLRFWRDVVGFELLSRTPAGGAGLERAWGLEPGTGAEVAVLRYAGIATGQLRLVQFTTRSGVHVRTRADDPWAIGIGALDCNVRDPEGTFRRLRDAGYESEAPHPHYYVIDGLEQSEVVFRTPDHVNLVLVGAMNYPPAMARPNLPGDFSALTVVSQFVRDIDASAKFYGDGLGLELAFDAWVDDRTRPLINAMVGIPAHADLRLAAYRTPGEPDGKTLLLQTKGIPVTSIADRMRPPHLGVVMLSHATDDLDGLRLRLRQIGGTPVTVPGLVPGAGGSVRSFLARAPGGTMLEFYEEAREQ
ncbi:MAG: VOC family protein [Acidobacteria bacterium]|nr:VOC family protein [Acidobacteriota bacterium]